MFFELFLSRGNFPLIGCRFKNDLLGVDDLLFGIIESTDGFHFRGNATADNFGEVLGREKITDVVVKTTGSSEGTGLIFNEVRVGFLVIATFGICKEDIFDEAFHFIVAWSDSVFKASLLSVQAICDEFIRRTASLQILRHLRDD